MASGVNQISAVMQSAKGEIMCDNIMTQCKIRQYQREQKGELSRIQGEKTVSEAIFNSKNTELRSQRSALMHQKADTDDSKEQNGYAADLQDVQDAIDKLKEEHNMDLNELSERQAETEAEFTEKINDLQGSVETNKNQLSVISSVSQ